VRKECCAGVAWASQTPDGIVADFASPMYQKWPPLIWSPLGAYTRAPLGLPFGLDTAKQALWSRSKRLL
jgi:hypothetical protein